MLRGKRHTIVVVALALGLVAAACGSSKSDSSSSTTTPSHETRRVPDQYPTIQAAVDAAKPGDLVLVSPGVYKEEVVVQTEDVVLRGTDRNGVIVDGEFTRDNGIKVFANGVAVENLTTRNNKGNGLFFTGDYDSQFTLTGYRASYVTAYNNGDYGIYAFNATKGQLDHDYASGNADSGFYIGQCNPCDAVISQILSENNQLGYSGTNSSTNLYIVNSEWRNNMIGIVPNSQDGEKLAPQGHNVIAGNWVHDNNNSNVPMTNANYRLASGVGIIITGGVENVVTKNRVENNLRGGIGVILWPFRNEGLPPFEAIGNKIQGNYSKGAAPTGLGDLVMWLADSSAGAQGNCFADNEFTTSFPENIQQVAPCTGEVQKNLPDIDLSKIAPGPEGVDYKSMAPPGPQPNMPDAANAPVIPAGSGWSPMTVDVNAVTMPTGQS